MQDNLTYAIIVKFIVLSFDQDRAHNQHVFIVFSPKIP